MANASLGADGSILRPNVPVQRELQYVSGITPPQRDRRLVDRCLAGDPAAWDELYRRFHDGLAASIKVLIGFSRFDADLIDEIAARVWYAVVRDGGALLGRFDPERGCRLSTYLATIARSEASTYFRSERRRRQREQVASRPDKDDHTLTECYTSAEIDEFLTSLTPRERQFCLEVLLDRHSPLAASLSPSNIWQLRSRISGKLLEFVAP